MWYSSSSSSGCIRIFFCSSISVQVACFGGVLGPLLCVQNTYLEQQYETPPLIIVSSCWIAESSGESFNASQRTRLALCDYRDHFYGIP